MVVALMLSLPVEMVFGDPNIHHRYLGPILPHSTCNGLVSVPSLTSSRSFQCVVVRGATPAGPQLTLYATRPKQS
jgi:hypothetical protein